MIVVGVENLAATRRGALPRDAADGEALRALLDYRNELTVHRRGGQGDGRTEASRVPKNGAAPEGSRRRWGCMPGTM